MDIWNEPIAYKKGAAYLGAGFTIKPIAEDHIGALRAMDPKTGKIVWEYKNKAPLWGGVLSTAGNLVFTGTPEGYLKAFDAKRSEEHTSELQSLMRISYAVFCLKNKINHLQTSYTV